MNSNELPTICPECGAPQVSGLSCFEMLGAIIAWEWQDPELLAEHFFTVASYNLQHPAQFTEETLSGLRSVFIERLDHNLPIAEIRRRVSQAAEGKTRVRKPESERTPILRPWPMTIADVYKSDHPQGAAGRVRAWAAAIRKELHP
ncbi:MAG TPA: DUF5946 family protein [Bacillota bacterium]|nr:DUF5946 family protein [Bacillota bacterium]